MPSHSDLKDRLMGIVRTINRTCMEGRGFDKLTPLFHEDVVMVQPGFSARAKGREVCLKSYEDACSQMTFEKLDASDEQIDVFGSTAILAYKYDCAWQFKGRRFEDDGHEILVFVREGDDWKVAWRTLVPGARQAEMCPVEEEKARANAGNDIRRICLDLMAATPACYLTTIDADGFPLTTAMNNLRYAKDYPSLVPLYEEAENEFLVYITTNMPSAKMARLRANPKVSVYFCDPGQIIGFTLSGQIEIVTDQALKDRIWQEGWTMYYPDGPHGSEYGILRLAPKLVRGWCRNQPFEIRIAKPS